jgi:hypothetical protein
MPGFNHIDEYHCYGLGYALDHAKLELDKDDSKQMAE